MKKILIATHGNAAGGVADTLKILTGIEKNVFSISAYTEENQLENEISHFFEKIEGEDTAIIFTDMIGGSVNQAFLPFSDRSNVHVITGFNIPLVLELALESRAITDSLIEEKIEVCRHQMFLMKTGSAGTYTEDEEDFFKEEFE